MTGPLLSARQLVRTIDGREVLSDVALDIYPAERVALVGPSGSGKTTLLTLLAGLIRPTTGEVRRGELPAGPLTQRIAIVLQGYGLVGTLTAAENVEVALRAGGCRPADAMCTAARTLGLVGLDAFTDHLVYELSGGQRQRVAVARALAVQPAVLLADEPTAEQDAEHEELVLHHLLALAAAGAAVVIATHDAEVAKRCDRVIRLADGRVVPDVADEGKVKL